DPNVLVPTKTAFVTRLIDLVDYIDPKSRYSYTYDGSAQVLDHMLVNKPTRERVLKFGYARLDADFPFIYSSDPSRPERISDHDPRVLFLSVEEPKKGTPEWFLLFFEDAWGAGGLGVGRDTRVKGGCAEGAHDLGGLVADLQDGHAIGVGADLHTLPC